MHKDVEKLWDPWAHYMWDWLRLTCETKKAAYEGAWGCTNCHKCMIFIYKYYVTEYCNDP